MGLLKHFRSRARLKSQQELQDYPKPRGPDRISNLPDRALRNIFSYVCPAVTDETFRVNERSLVGAGCSLCDLRDLASCAKVNHRWYSLAQPMLFHSVRIDAVHFCPHEEELAELRKKTKLDPGEIPAIRLRLFQRTVWKNANLAALVLFLKLPYMTRETCIAELARTVSALPNLRHVDLPEGFFSADPTSQILRDELQASCHQIRRMAYKEGAEQAFEMLAQHQVWSNLESISLERLDVDLSALRIVLASLPALQEVKLRDMPRLDDAAFQSSPNLPEFPAIAKLQIRNAPGITAQGLVYWLGIPESRHALQSLGLTNTGVTIPALHTVLSQATRLTHLSIVSRISRGMPLEPVPALTSRTLSTLNFEVTSTESSHLNNAASGYGYGHAFNAPLTRPTDSYYTYLSGCVLSNFPELLLLPPPRAAANSGFHQMLEIYTKGEEDLDWAFTHFAPVAAISAAYNPLPPSTPTPPRSPTRASLSSDARSPPAPAISLEPPIAPYAAGARNSYIQHRRHGSGSGSGPLNPPSSAYSQTSIASSRPISAFGAAQAAGGLGPSWGVGEARRSVMLGNGMGGFLEVPQAPPVMPAALEERDLPLRPGSSGGGAKVRGQSPARPSSSGGGGFFSRHSRVLSAANSGKGDLWR